MTIERLIELFTLFRVGGRMASKKLREFGLSSPGRRLTALISALTLTACHASGGGGGGGGGYSDTLADSLGGTLSGLVGSRLALQNKNDISAPMVFNGPGANGTYLAFPNQFGAASFNTSYDLTVVTQPTNPSQTCVVANGTGTAAGSISAPSNVTNIIVTCTTNPPRFLYVANGGSNNVSAYTVDAARGTLAAVAGSPFAAGNLPVAIAVDSTGNYAYVTNQTDATISAFTIDRASGALTAIKGSPFPTGPAPNSVAIDPSSSFVYVTNSDAGTVSAYSINAGGALTAVAGSPFATGTSPSSVAVDPLELYVYVANQADGSVSAFSINAPTINGNDTPDLANGALISIGGSPFAAGTGPRAVAADPSGQFVYVANASANTLSGLLVQNSSPAVIGSLTALSGSPHETGTGPNAVGVDPLDKFLYVANEGSNNISGFALGAGGALTALAGSPFAAGGEPSAVAVDPTGSFLYIANAGSGNVSVFAIDSSTGALSAVSGSPYTAGTLPSALAISD
jgi:6-phosphogluconolactonase